MLAQVLLPLLLPVLRGLWRGLQAGLRAVGLAVAAVAMSLVYGLVVGPVALGFRLFRPDPTDRGLGDLEADSYAQPARLGRQDLRRSQRPY